jgi:acetyl-CoA C-acetyltransferase
MVPVSARKDLGKSPDARITGSAALRHAGLSVQDLPLIDLYSCFPSAVELFAEALGLPVDGKLTLTGGMAFAGGTYNNYFFQSTCRAIELMREGSGRTALLSCASGILTKQAFAIWPLDKPAQDFVNLDLSEEVARETGELEVIGTDFTGAAQIADYTVLHSRDKTPRGVVLVDVEGSCRAVATSENPELIQMLEAREMVGRQVRVEINELVEIY